MIVAKETARDAVLHGDPVVGGASIDVFANGATSPTQTFVLPAGTCAPDGVGWRAIRNPSARLPVQGREGHRREAPSAKLAGHTSWERLSVFAGSYGEGHLPAQDSDPSARIYKPTGAAPRPGPPASRRPNAGKQRRSAQLPRLTDRLTKSGSIR